MLQLQIAVNLFQYSSVTCRFFRSTYKLKKILNLTFEFLIIIMLIIMPRMKVENLIHECDLCTITLFLKHTHPHKTNYSLSKSQSLPEELLLLLSSPSLFSALVSSVVSSSSSSLLNQKKCQLNNETTLHQGNKHITKFFIACNIQRQNFTPVYIVCTLFCASLSQLVN